jgi:hypothetical protein
VNKPFEYLFTAEHHQFLDCSWLSAHDRQCSQRPEGSL